MIIEKVLNLKMILKEIEQKKHSLIITLPSSEKWTDYEKELEKVKNYSSVMNFKVHNFPKGVKEGDKCYVVHNGVIRGWMKIVGFSEKNFICSTSKREYDGKFIERSGPFHYLEEKLPMKGFQGYRYFDFEDYKLNFK